MNQRLKNKVALVTGAGSGIGRATSLMLAREGATVAVADIAVEAAQGCAEEINATGGVALAIALDVTQESAWRTALETVLAEFARLDVLVNSAGISISKPISRLDFSEWREVLGVNLDGVFLGTKLGIEAMNETGGGSIVNVASVAGIKPYGETAAYGVSKAAVRMFSKVAAIECADKGTGIRVNLVTPGGVRTPMWDKEAFFQDLATRLGGRDAAFAAIEGKNPSEKFFSAEDVAQTILFLASDESNHLSGVEIVLDRGHTG